MVVNGKVPLLRSFSLSPILNLKLSLKEEGLATHQVRPYVSTTKTVYDFTNYTNKLLYYYRAEPKSNSQNSLNDIH